MGGRLWRTGCALIVALVVVPSASARFGGARGFSFLWPADGILTSPFGPRPGGFHPGIDIGVLRALDVRAAAAGRVVAAGYLPGYDGYGKVVVVALGGGFSAIYAHLARTLVRQGEVVLPGTMLGVAGCTGWCTGTHLHFELRERGRPLDPLFLFARYTDALAKGG